MDRLVITIRPAPADDDLLRVEDAMLQVLDAMRLLGSAEKALVSPDEAFDWRLESATTNSPLTIVARAEARHSGTDITAPARRVRSAVSQGMRALLRRETPPSWMRTEALVHAQNLLKRTRDSVCGVEIDFAPEREAAPDADTLVIDRSAARAGIEAIAAFDPLSFAKDLPRRRVEGEVRGVIVAAGRYYRKPAIQVLTEQYGIVRCTLSPGISDEFGTEHHIADVWSDKTVGLSGRLTYAAGKLIHIEIERVREIASTPIIGLDEIRDPNFTTGLSPAEYLDRLHAGDLV